MELEEFSLSRVVLFFVSRFALRKDGPVFVICLQYRPRLGICFVSLTITRHYFAVSPLPIFVILEIAS